MADDPVETLLRLYPRIFYACHTRHVREPRSGRTLSAHQASILDHLDAKDPMTLAELAEHMGVTPATMCLHVERLARRGYLVRSRDPRDARRARLLISESGLRVRGAKSVLDPERVRALLRCLSPRERDLGLRGLSILARAAGEAMRRRARAKRHSKSRRRKP
jgi:DNA-binding MarR family transcriptional regulator